MRSRQQWECELQAAGPPAVAGAAVLRGVSSSQASGESRFLLQRKAKSSAVATGRGGLVFRGGSCGLVCRGGSCGLVCLGGRRGAACLGCVDGPMLI